MTPKPSGRTVVTQKATTRKAATTIRRHFNPRIIIRNDDVNRLLAHQGINVEDLADFEKAEEILQIPRVSVKQADYAEYMIDDLIKTVIRETDMGLNTHPSFCTGITPEYIRKSIRKCDILVYIKNQQYPYDILGFATLNVSDNMELYVDVICTNQEYVGMGRHMLEKILLRLKDVLGLQYITLCSTRSAYSWYVHMGFERIENDRECPRPMKKMRMQRKTVRRPRTVRTFMQ